MTYYSHSSQQENGEVIGSKLLKEHIEGVRAKAFNQFYKDVRLGPASDELQELLRTIVDYHDLGKYTSYFQDYLLNRGKIDHTLKQHARFGGYAAYNHLKDQDDKKALIALYLIFQHHSSLLALDDLPHKLNPDAERVFKHQLKDLQAVIPTIEQELNLPELRTLLSFPNPKLIRRKSKIWVKRENNIGDYFLINYLFSLLIEADKLDASNTQIYKLVNVSDSWVDKRFGASDLSGFGNLPDLSNNELRNYCRAEVVGHLQNKDILNQRLFTLTAPTGIGKTMTALDFALKLKTKLRAKQGYEPQIIYALPFINIIEQAIDEYKQTLPENDLRILGHYQFADVFGIQSDSDEEQYHQKLMKMDTWQGDVVITSFVQFFETVIGNRNKLLKKFNHLAGSIIILDEVQTLRLDQMPLIGATLYYLAKFLDARIIMMTATKPKVFELAEQEILQHEGEKVEVKELLTSHEKVFSLFQRTVIYPLLNDLGEKNELTSEKFVAEVFDAKWSIDQSCIVVCNTVNRSIEVFKELKGYLKENGYGNPVFYLSTNIIPAIRMDRIKHIKESILNNQSPILVSTQVVEAGVDLDFDMGFRDLGPVDSIIQVAGRINRKNDKTRSNAPLFIIDFNECAKIYGQLTYRQAQKALEGKQVISESEYLQVINEYFDNISGRSSFLNSRKYFKSMKSLKYDSDTPKEDYAISSFRIIEESDIYRAVFIELNERATELGKKYLGKITSEVSKEEFDRKYKLKFQQHIISVPHYFTEGLLPINEYEEDILAVSAHEIDEFYDTETGFIRDRETDSIMIL